MMHFMLKTIFQKIWQTQIPKQKDNLNHITCSILCFIIYYAWCLEEFTYTEGIGISTSVVGFEFFL